MTFLVRFLLGLPARQEDIKELNKILPELLLNKESFVASNKLKKVPWWILDLSNEDIVKSLKRWVKEVELESPQLSSQVRCPKSDCPLKNRQGTGNIGNEETILTYLLSAGGGPDAKPPKDMFFDLVRKSIKDMTQIKEVILTDPYIYSDISEDGINGGFNNLISYLRAVGITAENTFTLKKNPAPKKATNKSKELLDRMLKKNYPNISLGQYSPKCDFHDRFYIVRDDRGRLRGVFGPSLNGLNSNAIVLMGEIDSIQPLKKLNKWL